MLFDAPLSKRRLQGEQMFRRSAIAVALLIGVQVPAQSTAPAAFDGFSLRTWTAKVIEDSSARRRNRAAAALRRAPPAFRREFVRSLRPALQSRGEQQTRALAAIGTLINEGQFGTILEERGHDLVSVAPLIAQVAEEQGNPSRRFAWFLLTRTDSVTRKTWLPTARKALQDSDAGIRWQAVDSLGHVRDSADFAALLAAFRDTDASVRELAMLRVGRWQPRRAVEDFMNGLTDSDTDVRDAAILGLGRAGPSAATAVQALIPLLADSSESNPIARSVRANAAWALSAILPRLGRENAVQLEVMDAGAGIRSDGLGPYIDGVDSVAVSKGASLNLDLGGPRGDGRVTTLRFVRPLRRSLVIDLTRPSAGARSLGLIRDNEAVTHMTFTHVHERYMVSVNALEPSDSLTPVERVEFQFRINGMPHLLQMGEWTQGEFSIQPRLHGDGTATASVAHTDASTWTVTAPPGSLARLWDLSDPERPVDKGLYEVPFRFRWSLLDPP
jgi:hypothetical protein